MDVKAAFDAEARPGGPGGPGEAVVPATDRALGAAARRLGLRCDAELLARLEAEGLVARGAGASVAFSGFLRVVGRLMQLFSLESLDAVLPRVAEEASASAAAAAAAAARPPPEAPAAPAAGAGGGAGVHGQDLTGPLFRADVARRLTLPPLPVPRELLRSIFERFSVARMVGGGGPASPGGNGGVAAAAARQSIVRGLPFGSWTAALAAAGVPVAPSEARELFRLLRLPLGELVSLAQLREAYLAVAGFRFLVTSGLFRDGRDMYSVVMSGRSVLGQVLLDARDVAAEDGGEREGGGGRGDDAVSDVSSDVGDEDGDGRAGGDARRALDMSGEAKQ